MKRGGAEIRERGSGVGGGSYLSVAADQFETTIRASAEHPLSGEEPQSACEECAVAASRRRRSSSFFVSKALAAVRARDGHNEIVVEG